MKDMPGVLPPGFRIAAALERGDPRDAFVSARHASLDSLPRGARIGTSSLRRQCQLRHRRPDLEVVVLRGNVDTRLRKLDAGDCDATVLAAAGLERLGLEARIRAHLSPDEMLPAVGQGIVGIECAEARSDLFELLRPLEHGPTRQALDAERAFSAALGASCRSPIAGYATLSDARLHLAGLAGSPDGHRIVADRMSGTAADAAQIGSELARRLLAAGAASLL
jgi:hydroxymethylbilane synthase